jgi:subtilisin family serine protease
MKTFSLIAGISLLGLGLADVSDSRAYDKIQKPPSHLLVSKNPLTQALVKRDGALQHDWLDHASDLSHVHADVWLIELKKSVKVGQYLQDLHASKMSSLVTIRFKFDSPLFHGVSLQFKPGTSLSLKEKLLALGKSSAVKKIWPNMKHSRTRPQTVQIHKVDNPAKNPIQLPGKNVTIAFPALASLTGVEQVHKQKITGKGIKVAVCDTGVDYKHPWLGGCFGKGCKVAYGYDFVGDEGFSPDKDPMV